MCILVQKDFLRRARLALESLSKLSWFCSVLHHIAVYYYAKMVSQRCLLRGVDVQSTFFRSSIVEWYPICPPHCTASLFGIVPHRTGQARQMRCFLSTLLD